VPLKSPKMISDSGLNTLAIFLGSLAMLLIVLYHFLEVNAIEDESPSSENPGVKYAAVAGQKEKVAMGIRQ
jgi:oligosaccharyl transferase complex subunit OST4